MVVDGWGKCLGKRVRIWRSSSSLSSVRGNVEGLKLQPTSFGGESKGRSFSGFWVRVQVQRFPLSFRMNSESPLVICTTACGRPGLGALSVYRLTPVGKNQELYTHVQKNKKKREKGAAMRCDAIR